ncbi:MFS transporter [Actinokineospora diospyrosa]|uniref:Drug resistance transporter, EmrB/QacA subfamily n=1 Tax=Actinokineospora diospyrosa TaxID=103728 RepID=A0ABT1IIX4_9PSEU|nr:MFS transporter [Actinokineospora diospyrosa]MCP2272605.1 drug resistance transporter, EmrB/QacA subfamily [Actinokineospora diospyrosa]
MATVRPTDSPAQLAGSRYWLILVLLCAAQFMVALDFSIVSVVLPTIGGELGFAVSDLQWVVTAFALPCGGFLLLFGRLGDLLGRRRIFLAGLALFTLTSLLGGLATSPWMLLAARAGQGLGAAMIVPSGMALITTSFPEGPQRDRALGVNGALISLGFTSGVVLGGVIGEALDWRWTMLINVPLGALVLVATPLLIGESRNAGDTSLDVPGAITVTGGLLAVIFGVASAEKDGWAAPTTLVALVVGVLLLAAFLAIEKRARAPLAPLHVLRRPTVGWGNLGGLITFSMITATVFLMTLYMQRVLAFNPLQTGLSFASLGLAAVVGGAAAPRLVKSLQGRGALVVGLVVQGIGTGILFWLSSSDSTVLLLVGTGIAGFGHMVAVVAYSIVATSGLPNEEQGLASGLITTSQLVGLTVGIPVLSSIATGGLTSITDDATRLTATLDGIQAGVLTAAAVIAFGVLTTLLFLRGRKSEPVVLAVPADTRASDSESEATVGR